MSSEWQTLPIGEIGKVVTGKTPSTAVDHYYGGEYPFYTPSDMDGRKRLESTKRSLSTEGIDSIRGSIIEAGAVMVSCIGSDMGKVAIAANKGATNQQINTILVSQGFDPEYIYYELSTRKDELQMLATGGSAQPILNKGHFCQIEICVPPIQEQKAIAHILGTLDDKIELNRKTNETLEEIAKALFKSWFVDFDPVRAKAEGRPTGLPAEISDLFPDSFEDSELGEIPSGWEVHLLGEAVSIQYGKNLPTLNLIPKGFPVFGGNGVIGFHSDYLFEDVMTLVSCRGAASGAVLRSLPKSFVTNNSLVIDHRNTSVPSQRYVEFFLSNTDTSVFVTGSAQPQVTIDSIRHLPILIPQSRLVEVFQDDLAPIGIKALLVDRQSKCLASIRDALLPKLISGEIRIPDAEKMLEEVGV